MILAAIVAMTEGERVIGNENRLPWRIPEDLQFFKKTTTGKKIIMGRKTWESINSKPLPNRENIVLTRNSNFTAPEGVKVFPNLEDAISYYEAHTKKDEEVLVVGGKEIFSKALPKINRIYMTIVHASIHGDIRFPEIDFEKEFKMSVLQPRQTSSGEKNLPFTIFKGERNL